MSDNATSTIYGCCQVRTIGTEDMYGFNLWFGLSAWLVILSMTLVMGYGLQAPNPSQGILFALIIKDIWFQLSYIGFAIGLPYLFGYLLSKFDSRMVGFAGWTEEARKEERSSIVLNLGFALGIFGMMAVWVPFFVTEKSAEISSIWPATKFMLQESWLPIVIYFSIVVAGTAWASWKTLTNPESSTKSRDYSGPPMAFFGLHLLNLFFTIDLFNTYGSQDLIETLLSTIYYFSPSVLIAFILFYFGYIGTSTTPDTDAADQTTGSPGREIAQYLAICGGVFLIWMMVRIRYYEQLDDTIALIESAGFYFVWFLILASTYFAATLGPASLWRRHREKRR